MGTNKKKNDAEKNYFHKTDRSTFAEVIITQKHQKMAQKKIENIFGFEIEKK